MIKRPAPFRSDLNPRLRAGNLRPAPSVHFTHQDSYAFRGRSSSFFKASWPIIRAVCRSGDSDLSVLARSELHSVKGIPMLSNLGRSSSSVGRAGLWYVDFLVEAL